mmetsp:Transcript_48657/g.118523  ORF Transcript_48657/g.118523 Transcript_48657/m.118523 type:complete len:444 (+) Transcript_48657:187-1518(+)
MFKGKSWNKLRITPKPNGLKYHFTVFVHCLKIVDGASLPSSFEELAVVWNRGAKVAHTTSVTGVQGVFAWEEKMSLLATLYRDEKEGGLQFKKAKFVVMGGPKHGKQIAICSCKVDLAKYAGIEDKESRVEMQFESKNKPFANLSITISSKWLKDAKTRPTDGMSQMSMSVISSADSYALEEDDTEDMSSPPGQDESPYKPSGFPKPLDHDPVAQAPHSAHAGARGVAQKPAASGSSAVLDRVPQDHPPIGVGGHSHDTKGAHTQARAPDARVKWEPISPDTSPRSQQSSARNFSASPGPRVMSTPPVPPRVPPSALKASPQDPGALQALRKENDELRAALDDAHVELGRREKQLHEFHLSDQSLRQQLKALKAQAFTIARDMTCMEVELHEYEARDVVAEETERLTLAYVPVIRGLTQELEETKRRLENAEKKHTYVVQGKK